LASLAKDQYFFGNNPNEKENKTTVPFCVKTKLHSAFTQSEIGEAIFKMLNKAARLASNYLTDEELKKSIIENLDPISHVISKNYHSEDVHVGKRILKKVRKPNPIKASPLMLKEEINLLKRLSSSVFSDLKTFSESYYDQVMTIGHSAISQRISEIIKHRWELLAQFANVTKKRLQDIRKITGKSTLKKADTSREEVELFLKQVADVNFRFHSEILQIIPISYLRRSIEKEYKIICKSDQDVTDFVFNLVFKLWENHTLKEELKTTAISTIDITSQSLTEDYEKALNLYSKITNLKATLRFNTQDVFFVKFYKLHNRIVQLNNLVPKINDLLEDLDELDNFSADSACNAYFERIFYSKDDFIEKSTEEIKMDEFNFIKDLKLRHRACPTEGINDLVKSTYKRFKESEKTPEDLSD